MNNKAIKKSIALLVTVALVAVAAALAPRAFAYDCNYEVDREPTVVTGMPTNVDGDSATLNAYYSSGDACYNDMNMPHIVFEFGETSDMNTQSEAIYQPLGSHNVSIEMKKLEPGETYYYRAVLYYESNVVKGSKVKFETYDQEDEDDSGLSVTESNQIIDATRSSSATTTRTVANTTSTRGLLGSVVTNNTRNVAASAPSVANPDMTVTIDNDEDVLYAGEFVTYEVEYENIRGDKELEDAVLTITLPDIVKFESATKGSYDNGEGAVIVNLRDIGPNEDGSVRVTGRVKNGGQGEAIATAEISYRDTAVRARETVTDMDIDEIDGTDSALTAGLFGGTFVPTSILGWLIIGLLLIAIIYLVRTHFWEFYWKKDRPQKPKSVQEHLIGQAPRA